MKKRLITSIVLLAILIPFLLIEVKGTPIFYGLGTLVAVLGANEMLTMFQKKHSIRPLMKGVYLFLTGILYFFVSGFWFDQFKGIGQEFTGIMVVIVFIVLLSYVLDRKMDAQGVSAGFLTIMYVGLGSGALAFFRAIDLSLVLYIFLITTCTDMFAYLVGVKFGKHKMAPYISPKKSYEGAIGGSLIATAIAVAFVLIFKDNQTLNTQSILELFKVSELKQGMQILVLILFSLGLTVIGQMGDLVASKFKRNYEIKDYSQLMPGHGGIMDRFDSVMFVSICLLSIIFIMG